MSGFVGTRAKKKQRNIFFTLVFLIFITIIIFIFPTFENNNKEIIPNDNIMPDSSKDLTSLISNIEELELNLYQKDQKIKFRDGQVKNLQSKLKNATSQYDSVILELNQIKENSDTQGLNSSNNYSALQDKFTKLNIQNDKNILIIKNLNNKIQDLNNNILLTDEEIKIIILDNKKLTKDIKIFFAKNIKLENIIKDLENNINYLNNEINLQLQQIKELKDKSHHGG